MEKRGKTGETAIEFHAGQNYFCIHPGLLGIMAELGCRTGTTSSLWYNGPLNELTQSRGQGNLKAISLITQQNSKGVVFFICFW